ncbi:MAG: protein kinase [Anaerolineales bacterium]|nr:MAG: protein kinase [Anaerolineales bacterium]
METLIGQTLGQYRIVEQIGKGGMATVFKAYQPGLDRYVAVKILPAYYVHEEGFSERFVREAKAIARLDHPNILPVYDFGQADGLSYIVMKYIAAGTLKDRLGQPLALEEALNILKQIAAALDHAHDQGILHRDVKPGNILIDDRDWVYLSDFGLAKMVEGSVQLTGSGVGVGTPAYMSPEQGQGMQVDRRTDVYALGIILYEMLTGRVPFEAETPMAVVVKQITSPLTLPRVINPAIPKSVERVILKALAKDAGDRFARAGELAQALEATITRVGPAEAVATPTAPPVTGHVPQPPPAVAYPPTVPPARVAPSPAYQVQPVAKKSSLPMLVVAGVAGLVVVGIVLVVALILLLGRDRPGPTVPSAAVEITATLTPVPEALAVVETAEPTPPTATATPVPTESPSPTSTPLPTDTPLPTSTPIPTNTPLPTPTPVPTDTPVPPTFTPTQPLNPDTGYRPYALFNPMWEELGGGSGPLGYPTGSAITDRNYARQYFERGFMYWWQSPTLPEPIWVVIMPDPAASSGVTWARYDNAWDSSKPLFPPGCPEATEPLGPMAGFGVTWCDRPGVKEQVGAPRERESGSGDVYPKGAVQFFQHGVMLENPSTREIWALIDGMGWRRAGY